MSTYSHYTMEQIRESGLLSSERMAEVEAAVEARISPLFSKSGKQLEKAKCAELEDGKFFMFANLDHDPEGDYMRRMILPHVLTAEETARINKECLKASSERHDAELYEKAEKIPEDEWNEGVFHGDEFYDSVGHMRDCLDEEDDAPKFVWAAEPVQVIPKLAVGDLLESLIEDRGWEDMDADDLNGTADLQLALDKFIDANVDVKSFREDCKTAIILNAPIP